MKRAISWLLIFSFTILITLQNAPPAFASSLPISNFSYTYDSVGNRLTKVFSGGTQGESYGYDNLYQLTSVSNFQSHSYTYDPLGNRLTADGVSYTPNSLNQYSSVGGVSHTYDLNGNLTSDGTYTYGYDYENRLTSVTGRGMNASYVYDPFGRRIQKTVNGTVTRYLYDGDQILEERDASNNVTAKYTHGPGIDEVLAMNRNNKTYYYYQDGLGSVTEAVESSLTVESYTYDPYGKVTIKDLYGTVLPQSAIGNPYLFTGRELDSETGNYYYRARHYHSGIGRFLQRDPIYGINLYTYTLNNPINWFDPYGLWVAIGERRIGPGGHTVIIIHPDNPGEFENDPRFYRNSKGELEATLSAGPNKRPRWSSPWGTLTATPNSPDDRREDLRNSQRILDPLHRSDSQLIRDIFKSADKYGNNLPYDPTPLPFDPYYNSNSYAYGILEDAGVSEPPNLPGWEPGADKPIPLKKK